VKAARKMPPEATPAPPSAAKRSDVTVHGFGFEFTDLVWDSRAMHSVPHYLCPEIQAGLVDHGPHWTCRICNTGATGASAEEAFAGAYRALDARVDRLTAVLNLVHERSGITT